MLTVRLATVLSRGVALRVHEAVAIAQLLVHAPGIPTPENVDVSSDGTLTCPRGTPPSPADIGALLLCLLGAKSRAPGGLRYAIARACGYVEGPPFRSVDELSASLTRFEQGERTDVVRTLLQRVEGESAPFGLSERPLHRPDAPQRSFSRVWQSLAVIGAISGSGLAGYLFTAHSLGDTRSTHVTVQSVMLSPATIASRISDTDRPTPTAGRRTSHDAIRALPDDDGQAFSPAFSRDGRALFFHTGGAHDPTSALVVASDTGSGDSRVTTILNDGARNYHVRPSSDGRLIAFDSDRDGERAVFVANRDGSQIRRISGPGYAAVPTWSPDGHTIAYIRAEPRQPAVWNIWIRRDGEREQRVTHFPFGQTWGAAWFPDGHRIALSHEHDLIVLDLTTRHSRRFASPIPGALVRTPAVSPDGSRIVFQVLDHGVWIVNLADGVMQCVLTDRTAEEFAWSPDGTRLAFHRKHEGRWQIYELVGLSNHRTDQAS